MREFMKIFTDLRPRNLYTIYASILVLILMFLGDPDNRIITNLPYGAGFLATIITQIKVVIAIAILHFTRKAMFDYIDLGDLYDIVIESKNAIAAAIWLVGVGLFVVAFAILIAVYSL